MSSRRALIAMTLQARVAARATLLIRLSLLAIVFLLNGDFHPDITPGGEGSNFQQYLGLVFWLVIIASSFFARPVLKIEWSVGLYVTLAFFGLAMASALWSDNAQSSLLKAAAQLVVLIGAWRLTATFPWEDVAVCMQLGLFAICLLSAAMAIFVPSVGVMSDYLHNGQWSGLFSSKQTLGVCAAMLLFFSTFRLMNGAGLLWSWSAIALALLCLLASGSRGGGALAVEAIGAIYLMSKSKAFARALAFAPSLLAVVGGGVIAYLLVTQNRYLVVFGAPLDFTQRTYIWQHALNFFWDSPWFGAGVNGFWTRSVVKELFLERYQWFLDNYHNGYIAIVMETGIAGYTLFLLSYLLFGLRMSDLIRGSVFPPSQTSFGVSYACLLFLLNFTETYFMRSTNILTTHLTMITAFVFARPIPAPAPSPAKAPSRVERRGRAPGALRAAPLWDAL
jgi:exopolysaccharide production protein ExoQ